MAEYSGMDVDLEIYLDDAYVSIGQIVDLDPPQESADTIEVSSRDSRRRKFNAGMVDGGEVTFDIVFDPDLASHDPTETHSIWAYMVAGTKTNAKITYPGSGSATTTEIFEVAITAIGPSAPLEDKLSASITLKVSDDITWAHVT